MAISEQARKNKNERKKVLAAEYKAQKRCICCGRQDERTLQGLTRCADCREKQRVSKEKYRKTHKAQNDEYREKYREKCRAEHRCVDCGKQDARTLAGHSACYECLRKRTERTRRSRQTLKTKRDKTLLHKAYHIARLFDYPLLTGDYQNGEYVTAEVYALQLRKIRKGETKENQD